MPRHVIVCVRYALELIECSCGAEIRAERDSLEPDRHGPLVEAWTAHRLGVDLDGLRPARGRTFVRR